MKQIITLMLSSIILSSCSFHYFGKTPSESGTYPVFTERDTIIGMLDSLRAGYDVTFYDLDLKINPEKKTLVGKVSIHFTALENLDKIRIDLFQNFIIDSMLLDGQPLSFRRNDRAVIVQLSSQMQQGTNHNMMIMYEGTPVEAARPPWEGGLVWKKDKNDNPWIGVACETEGPSIWFPCKDHPSDEPDSVRLRMSVPEGLKVVSNGRLKEHTSGKGEESYTWETHYPINPYNITFYAADFVHFSDTLNTPQGVLNLDYHVLPYNLDVARSHFRQTKEVISVFTDAFGPFPWIKEGFKLVESPFAGMEHQTAIAYGNGYRSNSIQGGDPIIIHEAAHEWWGNAVTVSDYSDIWLQEGFATYAEFIFVEHKLGHKKALEYFAWYLAPWIKNKLPVVGPTNVSYWDHRDNDVYHKGAMILHTIRNIISDDTLFFDIIKTFYHDYAVGAHPVTADFINLVENKTGRSWKTFFDVYLYQAATPFLEWDYTSFAVEEALASGIASGVPVLIAKWSRVPDDFVMPVRFLCTESKIPVIIEVTTKPLVYYLPKTIECNYIICNPEWSYFENKLSKDMTTRFLNY